MKIRISSVLSRCLQDLADKDGISVSQYCQGLLRNRVVGARFRGLCRLAEEHEEVTTLDLQLDSLLTERLQRVADTAAVSADVWAQNSLILAVHDILALRALLQSLGK